MKGDNEIILLHVRRRWDSLRIPPGTLGRHTERLMMQGILLDILCQDPTRVSFRRERIRNLRDKLEVL